MRAFALAHAYVNLDRLVFHRLQESSDLQDFYTREKEDLRKQEGWESEFQELCAANAEPEELLWILAGWKGLPGFSTAQRVFGWPPDRLKKGLLTIEQAAATVEKALRHPFGILMQMSEPFTQTLPESLRSFVTFARAAQSDFGHGAEWFLNIAKARLVMHVTYRTKDYHDREVSGLIAAKTGKSYSEDALRRWRMKHRELIEDAGLDPYTMKSPEERDASRRVLEEAMQVPEAREAIDRAVTAFAKLTRLRTSTSPRNR